MLTGRRISRAEPINRRILRFSLGGLAFQSLAALLLLAASLYLTFEFAFHAADLREGGGRRAASWDFLRSNDGIPGTILFGGSAFMLLWLTGRVIWRFLSDRPLAILADTGLQLHRTYLRREHLGYDEIERIDLTHEGDWRFLATVDRLSIYPTAASEAGRLIRIRSIEVEGGRPALVAFAQALAAQLEPG